MSVRRLIGGEFELDYIPIVSKDGIGKLTQNNSGTWTTNGRSALYLILKHLKSIGVRHIHLPAFLCESIILPVKSVGMDYLFYPVKSDLTAMPDPPRGSAVLLIHYFGWVNPATASLRKEAPGSYYLIEDASHVFLNKDFFCNDQIQYLFFTPRKFAPTILGGWCNINIELDNPPKEIELCAWKSLVARMTKFIYLEQSNKALDQSIEDAYLKLFREVDALLDSDVYPTTLPKMILEIIDCLDWEKISNQRQNNWQLLDNLIRQKFERLSENLTDSIVPMGYVIKHKNRDVLRKDLENRRIFAPVHWSLPKEIKKNRFPNTNALADSLLTIPIDQRYNQDDIAYIANTLISASNDERFNH